MSLYCHVYNTQLHTQIKLSLKDDTWNLTFILSGTSTKKGSQTLNYVVTYHNNCWLFFKSSTELSHMSKQMVIFNVNRASEIDFCCKCAGDWKTMVWIYTHTKQPQAHQCKLPCGYRLSPSALRS